jgi:hypothetical protein
VRDKHRESRQALTTLENTASANPSGSTRAPFGCAKKKKEVQKKKRKIGAVPLFMKAAVRKGGKQTRGKEESERLRGRRLNIRNDEPC